MTLSIGRIERFGMVDSTNDVVRDWLADGTPEVCVAIADEQTDGRGRDGRSWVAPPGAALLLSLGFRPSWLAPEHTWRLAASVALAMAEAAESAAGLAPGTIRAKWPNDLVIETPVESPRAADLADVRKLAGLLGETVGLGTTDPQVVVGIGINADWAASWFPPELAPTMTSLRVASGDHCIDGRVLADDFLTLVTARCAALQAGAFDGAAWTGRQLTTGRTIRLDRPDGTSELLRATGVDPESGALLVEDPATAGSRPVFVGEIRHVRVMAGRPGGV